MNKLGKLSLCLCLAVGQGTAQARDRRLEPLSQAPGKAAQRGNPYASQPGAAGAGQKLYERECSGCHGTAGQGGRRGPAVASPTVAQSPPGAIFWVLRNGSLRAGMPSFSHLPEAQRWQIVTYLKSLQ